MLDKVEWFEQELSEESTKSLDFRHCFYRKQNINKLNQAALSLLIKYKVQTMKAPKFRRPNSEGNWGIKVVGQWKRVVLDDLKRAVASIKK